MAISFGPNKASPSAIPKAPIIMTHNGIDTFAATSDWSPIVDTIAASGPTVFATYLRPDEELPHHY